MIFFWFLFFSFWNHSRNGTRSTLLRSRPRKTKTYACATLCLFFSQVLCHCPRFRVKFSNFCTCLRLFLSLSLSPWMNRLTCVQKHMPRLSRRPHFSAFLPIQIENVFSSSLPINSMHLSHAGREEKWRGVAYPFSSCYYYFFFQSVKFHDIHAMIRHFPSSFTKTNFFQTTSHRA